jgi:hypothetical protein
MEAQTGWHTHERTIHVETDSQPTDFGVLSASHGFKITRRLGWFSCESYSPQRVTNDRSISDGDRPLWRSEKTRHIQRSELTILQNVLLFVRCVTRRLRSAIGVFLGREFPCGTYNAIAWTIVQSMRRALQPSIQPVLGAYTRVLDLTLTSQPRVG